MKFNRYPLNIEEYESTEVIMEVKNEIQLSIGDNNTDSRKKVVRILINLKENLRNNEEKLFDNDEETLNDQINRQNLTQNKSPKRTIVITERKKDENTTKSSSKV